MSSEHYTSSSLRESIIEHIFIGECLRRLWQLGIRDMLVLRADVDAGGYDLVFERGPIVRHIQLKASFNSSSVRRQPINALLCAKPSGCLVWIGFDRETMLLGPYHWFGGEPGKPCPDLSGFRKARRTTANAHGVKPLRANTYEVPLSRCTKLDTIDELLFRLFGPLDGEARPPS